MTCRRSANRRSGRIFSATSRAARYTTTDHPFEGTPCTCGACDRPHHHARIRSIDTSAAERNRRCQARSCGRGDIPKNLNTLLSLIGFGKDDEPLLSPSKVAYRGEPVLAVIADSDRVARKAVNAVRVDWETLPHVLDVEQALQPGCAGRQ